ncbi:GON domain-containing protein [Cystobacter fuscus]
MALTATAALLLPGLSHAAATCAEFHAQYPNAGDGSYTLVIGNQPVDVYCHDMAGTPREFLTLSKTGSTTNYALYGQSPNTSAGGLKTGTPRRASIPRRSRSLSATPPSPPARAGRATEAPTSTARGWETRPTARRPIPRPAGATST